MTDLRPKILPFNLMQEGSGHVPFKASLEGTQGSPLYYEEVNSGRMALYLTLPLSSPQIGVASISPYLRGDRLIGFMTIALGLAVPCKGRSPCRSLPKRSELLHIVGLPRSFEYSVICVRSLEINYDPASGKPEYKFVPQNWIVKRRIKDMLLSRRAPFAAITFLFLRFNNPSRVTIVISDPILDLRRLLKYIVGISLRLSIDPDDLDKKFLVKVPVSKFLLNLRKINEALSGIWPKTTHIDFGSISQIVGPPILFTGEFFELISPPFYNWLRILNLPIRRRMEIDLAVARSLAESLEESLGGAQYKESWNNRDELDAILELVRGRQVSITARIPEKVMLRQQVKELLGYTDLWYLHQTSVGLRYTPLTF
ncbi:hypothetical protein J7M00_02330 [bacterium]|nr:hypothetical protein [bacterium]